MFEDSNIKMSLASTMPISFDTIKTSTFISHSPSNLAIFNSDKYRHLFDQMHLDAKRCNKHLKKQQTTIQHKKVRASIATLLHCERQENRFDDKFNESKRIGRKKLIMKGEEQSLIGETNIQSQNMTRKHFFSNYRKVINLEEDALLLEYFLKDEEKQTKSKVEYLKNITPSAKHRRLTPSKHQTEHLYNHHDQNAYHSLKKRNNSKANYIQKCFTIAKNNPTFRRDKNFKEIQYILQENRTSIIASKNIKLNQSESQQENKNLRRFFLRYACVSEILRTYYDYIDEKGMNDLKRQICSEHDGKKINEIYFDEIYKRIIQYKTKKVVQFQDFRELLNALSSIHSIDILAIAINKYPAYFQKESDHVMYIIYFEIGRSEQRTEINKYLQDNKYSFILKLMFRSLPQKLLDQSLLPTKYIPQIYKHYGFSQKDIDQGKLLLEYLRMQTHNEGITFEQFKDGTVAFLMKGKDWRAMANVMRKIQMRKIL